MTRYVETTEQERQELINNLATQMTAAHNEQQIAILTKGYRWGRIQGWIILFIGVPIFIAAPFFKSGGAILSGALLMTMGAGLVGRRKYGVVLLYVQIILTYAEGYIA